MLGCASATGIQNIRQTDDTHVNDNNDELKFLTYNIRAGGGISNPGMSPRIVYASKKNLTKIADAIKYADADIVGLQEVRGYNQAKFIAEQLNFNFAYSIHGSQSWWGLAVLSKYQIISISTKIINYGGTYGDRIALLCNIDLNGKVITLFNVHYALENYDGQVNATMKFIETTENPVVLMGDLNRIPYAPEIEPIRENFITTCEAPGTDALCEGTGYGKIDYVFVDQTHFEVLDVGAVRKYWHASDHLPYWANVKLKN